MKPDGSSISVGSGGVKLSGTYVASDGLEQGSNSDQIKVKAGNGIEVTSGGTSVKSDGSSISVGPSGVKLSGTYVASDGLEQGSNSDQIKIKIDSASSSDLSVSSSGLRLLKSAILPWRNRSSGEQEYLGVACMEMPEVRIEDIIVVRPGKARTVVRLDDRFVDVCEFGSLRVVGLVCSEPALAGAKVIDGCVQLDIRADLTPLPAEVTLRVSGVRLGMGDHRFPRYSPEQMRHNNGFWEQAMQPPSLRSESLNQ